MKRQISLDGIIKQTELLQFDENVVYIGRNDKQRIINIEDILSLSKTSTSLNNRYFWKIMDLMERCNYKALKFVPAKTRLHRTRERAV